MTIGYTIFIAACILLAGIMLASVIPLIRKSDPRLKGPTCANCRYDLRGIQSLTCPECGKDLRETGITTPRSLLRFHVSAATGVIAWSIFFLVLSGYLYAQRLYVPGPPFIYNSMSTTLWPNSGAYAGVVFDIASKRDDGRTLYVLAEVSITVESNAGITAMIEYDPKAQTFTTHRPDGTPLIESPTLDATHISRWLAAAGIDTTIAGVDAESDEIAGVSWHALNFGFDYGVPGNYSTFTQGPYGTSATSGMLPALTNQRIEFMIVLTAWFGLWAVGTAVIILLRRRRRIPKPTSSTIAPSTKEVTP